MLMSLKLTDSYSSVGNVLSFWKLPIYIIFLAEFYSGFSPRCTWLWVLLHCSGLTLSGSFHSETTHFVLTLRKFSLYCFSDLFSLPIFFPCGTSVWWILNFLYLLSLNFPHRSVISLPFCIMFWEMSLGLSSRSLIQPLALFIHYSIHSLFSSAFFPFCCHIF